MIILITGSSHTGKTVLAQKLLNKYGFPYLSQDHLKMGLIRSGFSAITPEDDIKDIIHVIWPITREIIKTCIENKQNLTIEGCYIPFDFYKEFGEEYLKHIQFTCLIFSEKYIHEHYDDIINHAMAIEFRDNNDAAYCTREMLLRENLFNLEKCKEVICDYILIDNKYEVDITL
ncbi:MAG: adenylate kinase [Mobilitalea sp.]